MVQYALYLASLNQLMAIIISNLTFNGDKLEQREMSWKKSHLLPCENVHKGNREQKTATKELDLAFNKA